ncbi:MAG: GAF domain-containing protein, partial [Ktedonobacteraceae bacterium]|nr:GAF domain-containing protein [Ktedonobacteraceae bacterium]
VLFMGAESPVGQAVRTGRQHSKPDQHELEWIYSCYGVSSPGSFVATPILRDQRSAGCLYLFSPEMDFFRPDHLQLIQSYTELLSLAFEGDDFFGLNRIVLGVMPMPAMQKTLLDQFQQRVTQLMLHAKAEGRSLTRPEAEKQVWQALEAELLLLD